MANEIQGNQIWATMDGSNFQKYSYLPGEALDGFTKRVFEDVTKATFDLERKLWKIKKVFNEKQGFVWTFERAQRNR